MALANAEGQGSGTTGTATTRLPPVGFWSYARQDDELSGGRLSRLRLLLAQELQQQYGREKVTLFQDMNAIAHGSDWEREIRAALDQATFFIPIVTPNFVQSEWCCREVMLFLEREQHLREAHPAQADASRIFPILFIDMDDAEPEDPAVLAALQKLQWFDFRRYRHRSFDDPEVLDALSSLAGTMRVLLKGRVVTGATARAAQPPESATTDTVLAGAPPAPRTGSPRELGIGDRLNNIFEVKRFIKAGGMGQVFEGANVMTGERVAIKTLLPALAADPRTAALFQREAVTLTRLNHEALVQYRVLAEEPALGILYIVTEYVDGGDLAEAIGRVDNGPGELERLLARLAAGLAAAHRLGAIHRDISPDNVMLPGGDLHQAKIIDFGIAKDMAGDVQTIIGNGFAGKLSFVAPEQLGEYGGEIGPWTDVYSLALVILAVAKGEKVDMGGSFADAIRKRREVVDLSAAPVGLRPVLADMLRADPAERIRSMDAVLARLAGAPAPPATIPPAPDQREVPESAPVLPGRGRRLAMPLALAALLVVALGWMMLGRHTEPPAPSAAPAPAFAAPRPQAPARVATPPADRSARTVQPPQAGEQGRQQPQSARLATARRVETPARILNGTDTVRTRRRSPDYCQRNPDSSSCAPAQRSAQQQPARQQPDRYCQQYPLSPFCNGVSPAQYCAQHGC